MGRGTGVNVSGREDDEGECRAGCSTCCGKREASAGAAATRRPEGGRCRSESFVLVRVLGKHLRSKRRRVSGRARASALPKRGGCSRPSRGIASPAARAIGGNASGRHTSRRARPGSPAEGEAEGGPESCEPTWREAGARQPSRRWQGTQVGRFAGGRGTAVSRTLRGNRNESGLMFEEAEGAVEKLPVEGIESDGRVTSPGRQHDDPRSTAGHDPAVPKHRNSHRRLSHRAMPSRRPRRRACAAS